MVGRQLPFFSLLVPFWLIWAFAGWRGMLTIWPAILIAGVSFAIPQFLVSNYINPWIVDIVASLVSMACLVGFLKIWEPKVLWTSPALRSHDGFRGDHAAAAPGRNEGGDPRAGLGLPHAVDCCVRDPAGMGHGLVQGAG
jgi:lactate permease